jgi:hypothetical protein
VLKLIPYLSLIQLTEYKAKLKNALVIDFIINIEYFSKKINTFSQKIENPPKKSVPGTARHPLIISFGVSL